MIHTAKKLILKFYNPYKGDVFFDGLNLDINDLYYWARLYDQYVQGKSKVRK